MPGLLRAEAVLKTTPAPSGITVGTTGLLTYDTADAGVYTFTTGPTVDGGGAKMLLIPVWIVSFGASDDDVPDPLDAITLNGAAPDLTLFSKINNTAARRYVNAAAAIWDAPAAGQVVVDLSYTCTSCGCYYLNLTGLAASPLGALVDEQFTTGTALAFQATTTAANSLLMAIHGARTANRGPFVFDNGSFVSLGETGGSGNVVGDGSWDVGYRNGLVVGTYDCGGDWSVSDSHLIGGAAFELKAAA